MLLYPSSEVAYLYFMRDKQSKLLLRSAAPEWKWHTWFFLIPYKGMQISYLNILVLALFLFFFKKANNMCLLSEVNIRRLFFPSPVLCFCTKHKTDLILPYGDNQAALNTREKETIFICHARWDAQLLDTWSCSSHRRTQSRAEMPSQWTI